ncbi:4-(cytidine 5'-diphospho)-2-C-methyl-D-erythritol kinase [Kandleria sp.]|uniref:4-(cytidine 5'-diphospho)-2-C-methyl-D-erythritol kinase n=1 Tax=Kandleria sp. TaxID=2774291 RepID=UPI001B3FD2F4|nr:4-(cytidine 5'-diphospho)-2-C-methyl-D-erythritol kinase [Kandleria sp.]MBP3276668.1 4-(cytidine 5'-diphospho)-2-C-methyl-D-erythritol kinase [Kandleria sp.]
MKVRAYAKVNLALDVVRKREDGYHDLEMIMAPIALHDLIIIDRIESGIELTANTYRVPTDERNIMYKVAKLMIDKYHIDGGVRMHVYKHIPSQAGLAGGSADGAAVMRAINKLYKLHLSNEGLAALGKEVGADIPFCIHNKIALVKGIGEDLTFINDNHFQAHLLLVKPKKGVSTKRCFESLNIPESSHPDIDKMKQGIQENDYEKVVASLGNTLETPSLKMVKDIEKIKDEMRSMGFDGALMSGSGSCVFGITQDEELIERAIPFFRARYPFVRKTKILER